MYKFHSDINFGQNMIARLEKRWKQWEQPILLLSFLLHPNYRNVYFNSAVQPKISTTINSWLIYYYEAWFGIKPTNILLEYSRYMLKVQEFQIQFWDQFQNNILSYWLFINNDGGELSKVACQIYAISVNSASLERLFSSMKNIQTPIRNRLQVYIIILFYFIFILNNY